MTGTYRSGFCRRFTTCRTLSGTLNWSSAEEFDAVTATMVAAVEVWRERHVLVHRRHGLNYDEGTQYDDGKKYTEYDVFGCTVEKGLQLRPAWPRKTMALATSLLRLWGATTLMLLPQLRCRRGFPATDHAVASFA